MAGLGRRSHYRKHITDAVLHDFPEPDVNEGERIAKVVGTRGGNLFEIIVASSLPSSSSTNGDRKEHETGTGDVEDATVSTDSGCGDVGRTLLMDQTTNHDNEQDEAEDKNKNNNNNDNNANSINDDNYHNNDNDDGNRRRTPQLAILPTKFRKLVWLKRNDYVIVKCGFTEGVRNGTKDSNDKERNNKDAGGTGIRYLIEHILYKDQVKHLKSEGLWPMNDVEFNDTDDGLTNVNGIVVGNGNNEETNEIMAKALQLAEKEKKKTKEQRRRG